MLRPLYRGTNRAQHAAPLQHHTFKRESVETITEHRNISGKVLSNESGGLRRVVLLVAAAILGLALVFENWRLDPDALTDGDEVIAQRLEAADEVDQHFAVQIDQVIRDGTGKGGRDQVCSGGKFRSRDRRPGEAARA